MGREGGTGERGRQGEKTDSVMTGLHRGRPGRGLCAGQACLQGPPREAALAHWRGGGGMGPALPALGTEPGILQVPREC